MMCYNVRDIPNIREFIDKLCSLIPKHHYSYERSVELRRLRDYLLQ